VTKVPTSAGLRRVMPITDLARSRTDVRGLAWASPRRHLHPGPLALQLPGTRPFHLGQTAR
jgi:hypothetical protein